MSFGAIVGEALTTSNEFKAGLIIDIDEDETVPIVFDKFELIYMKGFQFFLRLGLEDKPGSKNELTLEAKELKAGQTYPIRPQDPGVRASFALDTYVEYFPADYSGYLNVGNIERGDDGKIKVSLQFAIYFKPDDKDGKPEMEVRCHALELSIYADEGTLVAGTFEQTSQGNGHEGTEEANVPKICEIALRVDGSYETIVLNDIYFVIYPDSSYFIQCQPLNGGRRATLEFRGDELKAYTNYPIAGIDGRKKSVESVETLFILRPEFSGCFSDPVGEFRVRGTHGSDEDFWCICEFDFSVTVRGSGGKETKYEVSSLVFQIQVNEVKA